MGGLLLALRSISQRKLQLSTLSTVHAAMSTICRVDSDMRDSQREAFAKKVDAADLASEATEHIEICSSVRSTVATAQTQTQTSLDTTSQRIARARQQIEENKKLSVDMGTRAREHDQKVKDNNVVRITPSTHTRIWAGDQ